MTDLMPEPADGTRLAAFVRNPDRQGEAEWIVIWRHDERGDIAYERPDPDDAMEGFWFSDQFDDGDQGLMWSEIAGDIVELYTLVPYDGGAE